MNETENPSRDYGKAVTNLNELKNLLIQNNLECFTEAKQQSDKLQDNQKILAENQGRIYQEQEKGFEKQEENIKYQLMLLEIKVAESKMQILNKIAIQELEKILKYY